MTKTNCSSRSWLGVTRCCGRASASSRRASAASARPSISRAMLLMLASLWLVLIPSALHAATITVNTAADPGAFLRCTLRGAINNANSPGTDTTGGVCAVGSGDDTIVFTLSGTITLGSALPEIKNTLTIDGAGRKITISGFGKYQVLAVDVGATLNLDDLTIAQGNSSTGGGILNFGGTLTVTNSTFSDNSAPSGTGGGILNIGGTLAIKNGTFSGNSAGGTGGSNGGGGIDNEESGTVTVTNSTFSGNSSAYWGGGIENSAGTLTVTNSTFSDNGADNGGGIHNDSTLTITNSTFAGNSAEFYGGGIDDEGSSTLSVTNSTFSKNSAGDGGGIFNNSGATLTVTNSTFLGASVRSDGGGIWNAGGATVSNSTFSGNGAPNADGGGIFNDAGTLSVTNSTFSGDNAHKGGGGGIANGGGTATVANSIFAKSSSGGDCFGTITDGGYNISDDATCGFAVITAANGDKIGDGVTDAHLALGTLANNGGPTKTIALEAGSYAIDAIPIADCPLATDQRGAPRPDPASPAETACDIGAFESGNLVWLAPSALDFGTITVDQSSPASVVTLYNQSGKKLTIEGFTSGDDFGVPNTTCNSVLKTGQSCDWWVTFAPLSPAGPKDELFQLYDSASDSPQQVQLQGFAESPS